MASLYKYIDSTGVIVPDTADLRQGVESEWRALFGEELTLAPQSPEGVLVTAETEARDGVVRTNAMLANQINPNLAGGVFLDAIAALTGLERGTARASLVVGLLRGVPSTLVPAGIEAETDSGEVFYTKTPVVLDESGRAETYFYSEKLDAVPCPAGGLNKIKKGVLGWETITNPAPATIGQAEEPDTGFRKRRKKTLFLQGVALAGAIQSALYDVPGVKSIVYRENFTSAPKIIDGKELAPHSVYLCVDGGEDEAVAQAIFANKSGGCGYNGAVCVNIAEPVSKQVYPVRFDRPEMVPMRARVTVKNTGDAVVDVQNVVRDAIVSYSLGLFEHLDGFCVGAGVSPFEVGAAVTITAPALFVTRVEVGRLEDDTLRADTYPLALWQKASITPGSIEVIGG